jgi:hypothetical protein
MENIDLHNLQKWPKELSKNAVRDISEGKFKHEFFYL